MSEAEIISKINGFLIDEFEIDGEKITPQASMQETLDLDSLDYIDLVVVIENNFDFKVKPEDFINIRKFQDLYNYVLSKVGEK